jgi:hypothetical protein
MRVKIRMILINKDQKLKLIIDREILVIEIKNCKLRMEIIKVFNLMINHLELNLLQKMVALHSKIYCSRI